MLPCFSPKSQLFGLTELAKIWTIVGIFVRLLFRPSNFHLEKKAPLPP